MPINLIQTASQMFKNLGGQTGTRTAADVALSVIDPVGTPQLAYMWEVRFEGLFHDDAKNLTFLARTAAIPVLSNDVIKRYYMGQGYAYAAKENSPRLLRINFWDNQNLDAYHYFQKWVFTMNDPIAKRSVSPVNYQRRIILDLKDTSDALVTERFVFDGCFPSEITEASLSYEASDPMSFDVMFHFEKRMSGQIGDTGGSLPSLSNLIGGTR